MRKLRPIDRFRRGLSVDSGSYARSNSQASGGVTSEGRVVVARFFHPLRVHTEGVFFLGEVGVGPPP